jgi:predicted DNA-binding antitoxin AbrB/MazE fold protein
VKTVHAIYENGVFRPTEPVELPEACHVEFEPRLVDSELSRPSLDGVYALLSQRFDSGQFDVAARHDEHQPSPATPR